MDINSQNKVLAAGYTIIRCDNYPQPRIKFKYEVGKEWATYKNYSTKAERDRAYKNMLEGNKVISD